MPDISSLAAKTTAAQALSNLLLVSPQATVGYQPLNPPNADGTPSDAAQQPKLLFHYEGEQTVAIESDITDHFIEDNTAIQDQIALKPEVITTHGFIGELNDVVPDLLKLVKAAADKLTVLTAYTPGLSTTALLAYSEAFFLYQVAATALNTAVSAWSSVVNLVTGDSGQTVIGAGGISSVGSVQSKQQAMFQQFYGYWRSRTLFNVQTPWAVFQNMAIKSLRAIQDPETRVITDFEVSFKMIRTASTELSLNTASASYQGRANTQASGVTNLGTSSPTPSIGVSDGLSQMGVA